MNEPLIHIGRKIEHRSEILFGIAGILILCSAVATGLAEFINIEGMAISSVTAGSSTLGWIVAIVGLIGFYPQIRESSRSLARGGIGSVGGALGGVIVIVGTVVVTGLPVGTGYVGYFVLIVLTSTLLLSLLGFSLFAIAGMRTDALSRTVSLLLFVPAIVWALSFILRILFGPLPFTEILEKATLSVAFLGIGYLRRTDPPPSTHSG